MEQTIEKMLEMKRWAVVGATPNKSKYGNKIFHKLLNRGCDVFPVNPNYDEIEGVKAYANLSVIDDEVDCVSVIVPAKYSKDVVKDAIKKGIKYMWFQPNSYDMETIEFAKENGITVVYGACILWG